MDFLYAQLETAVIFAVLFGCIFLLKKILRNKISAQMHYVLWTLVLIKLVVPVSFASEASPWNIMRAQAPVEQTAEQEDGASQDTQEFPPVVSAEPGVNPPLNESELSKLFRNTAIQTEQRGNLSAIQNTPASTADTGQAAQTEPFNWTLLLGLVWLCGAVGVVLYLLYGLWCIRRVMRYSVQLPIPQAVAERLPEIKRGLGIKREIRLARCVTRQAPAIIGLISPRILLPVDIGSYAPEAVDAVLTHELMHYKRGDLWCAALLNVLNIAYWFNPLVWLLTRLVRRDMENACDASVLMYMGQRSRQYYIATILQLSGKAKSNLPVLGMGSGKADMQQRIQSMFLKGRTNGAMRFLVGTLAALMVLMAFTTACQPTPEAPVVVNKNNNQLEGKIESTPQPDAAQGNKYVADAQWTETVEQGKIKYEFDAEVQVPDVSAFPVMSVKMMAFTEQQAEQIANALADGDPLQAPAEQRTRVQVEKDLLEMKYAVSEMRKGNFTINGMQYGDTVEVWEKEVKRLEQEYADAPESVEAKPAEFVYKKDSDLGEVLVVAAPGAGEQINVQVARGDGQVYNMNFWRHDDAKLSSDFMYSNTEFRSANYTEWPDDMGGKLQIGDTPRDCDLTREQAIAMADETARKLGADTYGMELQSLAVGVDPWINGVDDEHPEKWPQGWIATYTRTVNGVPTTLEETTNTDGEPMEADDGSGAGGAAVDSGEDGAGVVYGPGWSYDRLTIQMDDSGVVNIDWRGMQEIIETLNDNVELKSFEEIKEIVKKQLLLKEGVANEDPSLEQLTIGVDRMALGMTCVQAKDKPGEYMLIPVWDLFGYRSYHYDLEALREEVSTGGLTAEEVDAYMQDREREQDQKIVYSPYDSILTINAVDGSIIDRYRGY